MKMTQKDSLTCSPLLLYTVGIKRSEAMKDTGRMAPLLACAEFGVFGILHV
jgi:hypothetical protein